MSATTTLRLVRSASGADSVIRMFAGELDAAYIGMTPFLLARAHGLRLHLLGIANSLGSSHKVVVRLGAAQPRSVATVATSSAHQLAWTWATSLGLDVSYLDLSPADAVRAFEVGLVDAVSIWEPFAGKVEAAGGETRFDSAAAEVPMFNVLAASDASVRAKPSALRQLASAHSAAVATIRQGLSEESTDYLRAVLDLPLGHEEFITLLNHEHEWPDSPALDGDDLPDDLVESAHEAMRFLRAARLTPPGGEVEALERSALGRHGRRQETLSLGYSDSLMCAPLHIARHDGHLGENGMDVIQDQEPVVERLARLPEPLRRAARETIEFVGTQPAVATMACGRVLERVLERPTSRRSAPSHHVACRRPSPTSRRARSSRRVSRPRRTSSEPCATPRLTPCPRTSAPPRRAPVSSS